MGNLYFFYPRKFLHKQARNVGPRQCKVPFLSTVLNTEQTKAVVPYFNPLTPNDPYSGRTAPLTSKRSIYIFIQQI